jgi:hypothetical protein
MVLAVIGFCAASMVACVSVPRGIGKPVIRSFPPFPKEVATISLEVKYFNKVEVENDIFTKVREWGERPEVTVPFRRLLEASFEKAGFRIVPDSSLPDAHAVFAIAAGESNKTKWLPMMVRFYHRDRLFFAVDMGAAAGLERSWDDAYEFGANYVASAFRKQISATSGVALK